METPLPAGKPFGFEPVEHTADIGLRAWGRTLEELFTQAGLGMVSLLVNRQTIRAADQRRVSLAAGDLEEGLIAWLQEILYLYEVAHFVPVDVLVSRVTPESVTAEIRGEPLDRGRHELRTDIKAATYHDLRIRVHRHAAGVEWYETVVIFDREDEGRAPGEHGRDPDERAASANLAPEGSRQCEFLARPQ